MTKFVILMHKEAVSSIQYQVSSIKNNEVMVVSKLLAFLLIVFLLFFSLIFLKQQGVVAAANQEEDEYASAREEMVSRQVNGRGVSNASVLAAMRKVPRHEFVPQNLRSRAYDDIPLFISAGQTIPRPYIVALMTELLALKGGERVLLVGAGSGYQAAILAEIAAKVYTTGITASLDKTTEKRLRSMGYKNITSKSDDVYGGWEENAPFDCVMVTAASDRIPQPLVDQLKVGGKMVIPEISFFRLKLVTKTGDGVKTEDITPKDRYAADRERMVSQQIAGRGVSDESVLAAMRKVMRHEFVPERMKLHAYDDRPLPIGEDQTISQPYIVALMTELLDLKGGEKILEIGTGSGYQAAILAEIVAEVYTIEIVESLARTADERLQGLGYRNITVRFGDGYKGWKEHAPFDGVIVTAAPDHIPQPLVDQLKVGGRMVIPVGDFFQELKLLTKTESGVKEKNVIPVRFVPMTGEAQEKKK